MLNHRILPASILLLTLGFTAPATAEPSLDEVELEFLQRINAYREANGAPCLTPSPTMAMAAEFLSDEMGRVPFFSHQEPPCDDSGGACTGRNPFERIEAFGHDAWTAAGENIAAGRPDAEGVFEQWRNSPGHNANMLNSRFTSIGIARALVPDSPFRFYWTTDFSNYIDGTGDCNGEGALDWDSPVTSGDNESVTGAESQPETDPSNVIAEQNAAGGCNQGRNSQISFVLVLLFTLMARIRQRPRVASALLISGKRFDKPR